MWLHRSAWGEPEPDTVLATILFKDIVGSAAKAAELNGIPGDWRLFAVPDEG